MSMPQHATLSSSLSRAGARCLALQNSGYLLVARSGNDFRISESAARELSAVCARAPDKSVLLLGRTGQLEGLLDFDQLKKFQILDFSTVGALGLSPTLAQELGKLKRERKLNAEIWQVAIVDAARPDTLVRKTLEECILLRWIRKDVWPVRQKREASAVRLSDFIQVCIKHSDTLGEVQEQLSRSLLDDQYRTNVCLELGLRMARVQKELADKLTKKSTQLSHSKQVLSAEHSTPPAVRVVINAIESATEDLEQIGKALSDSAVPETTSTSDPVQNAIEIRESLAKTVNLLDAAKWAKWRGVKSKNPSAALDKYKKQRRVFAVKSGSRNLYPAFQFSENAEPLPVVQDILKVVPEASHGWSLLSWFEARNALLGDRKPSELLRNDPDAVLSAAERFYSTDV